MLAAALVAIQAGPAHAAAYDTILASRANGTAGAAGNGHSTMASISANGRFVAFVSDADNLSDQDDNGQPNVFVRDLQTGETSYVSRADGAAGAAADGPSADPSISADGRHVAFRSTAANLSTQDNDICTGVWFDGEGPCSNIFVRDLVSGTTTFVGRADGAQGAAADGGSFTPSISADGTRVAFTSLAANLSDLDVNECSTFGGDPHPCTNFFVRDLSAGATVYIGNGTPPIDRNVPCPAVISGNGRFVAYETEELRSPQDNNGYHDVVVLDLQSGTVSYASRADGAGGAIAFGGPSLCPSISADGRHVAFSSDAYNLSADDVDTFDTPSVYVRDLQDGRTTLASRADGAAGAVAALASTEPSISGDGRYVAFTSRALNLSGSDLDNCHDPAQGVDRPCPDVFVRDLQAQTTAFVSRASGAGGAGGDDRSTHPSISGDGKLIAFESVADNLSTEDSDAHADVYVRDWGAGLPPAPTIDLSVTVTASATAVPVGSNVTYTVRVTNAGPAPATGVAVTDQLPSGVTFVSAAPGQGTYAATTGVWSVGGLAAGATASLQLVGRITTAGQKVNTAQVSAAAQPDADSTPGNGVPTEDDQASVTVNGTVACPATATRTADYDTWITTSWSTTNFGKDAILKVRSKAQADARTLVHFALPSLPAGCKVTSAKLRLYLSSVVGTRTLRAVRLAGPWTETGVTWRNQPASTGDPATAPAVKGWAEWTVTPQVAGLYSAGNHGLLIRDAAEGAVGYEQRLHSRENTNKPTLTVSFGPS
ncbi:CBM96 family carbohydrate-binding protein [Catellatospora vulcania]|uniref:CBM96 family carbohydrate-binding protein n=1 Tax=Catellatospora vulcania TaxID=1460450 RepID=UPI0018AFE2A6|nr:DNRLRE domain-containing protein [Catellatospora vulcania]